MKTQGNLYNGEVRTVQDDGEVPHDKDTSGVQDAAGTDHNAMPMNGPGGLRRLAGVGHGYGAPSDPDDAELQDTLYWPAIHSVYGYTTEQECLQTSLRIAKSKGLLIECQG